MSLITALLCWMAIVLIVYFLIPLYNEYRIDLFRQKLFQLRGELFDWANSGGIDFDNESYIMLRENINNNIRMAYLLSLARILWVIIIVSTIKKAFGDGSNAPKVVQDKLKGTKTREQKRVLITHYERLDGYIAKHTMSAPSFIFGRIIFAPFIMIRSLSRANQSSKVTKKLPEIFIFENAIFNRASDVVETLSNTREI